MCSAIAQPRTVTLPIKKLTESTVPSATRGYAGPQQSIGNFSATV